ncbi:MAG: 5'/3'-nucleotidase SurE [Planctomycetes bacterium]|nr:5'/3'-nucleotidase SurE [Planctomycetota bacterium]
MAILIANDDGIDAAGLAALEEALSGLDDIFVSAPAVNQSGVGMAITIGKELKAGRRDGNRYSSERHAITGTPADAVKYGLKYLLQHEKPKLVISGINLGPNLGRNVRCSGTIGAAFEAATSGIPALAVSLDYVIPPIWDGAKFYARKVAEMALHLAAKRPGEAFLLNLNVPALPPEQIPGLVLARHGVGGFLDVLSLMPDGETLRMDGEWIPTPEDSDCDAAAFNAGYAVLTPMQFEMTDHRLMQQLRDEWGDHFQQRVP